MRTDATEIVTKLKTMVTAAQDQFDMAVAFHEVWKPAAFDADLHDRIGMNARAAAAFRVTQIALRREMVLALMRPWDRNSGTIQMHVIASHLKKNCVTDALGSNRSAFSGSAAIRDALTADIKRQARDAVSLIDRYQGDDDRNGRPHEIRENLESLRNQRLAHYALTGTEGKATREDIEEFYNDNSKLIQILVSVVNATAYNPEDTARNYQLSARFFWAGARGEQTEGHPNYSPRPA